MTTVHGRPLAQALRRAGSLAQLARIDASVDDDGPSRGARRLRIVSGGGLEVEVHPDRCLDLGHVTFEGVPLAWVGPAGIVSPGPAETFAAHFGGGLLTTCGLEYYGPLVQDGETTLPQHGSIRRSGARLETVHVDEVSARVVGTVRQTTLFGDDLVLTRRIDAPVGRAEVTVTDTVRNAADHPRRHMLLYHLNLGWPLLDDGVGVALSPTQTVGIDERAAAEVDAWDQVGPPAAGYLERVYRHDGNDGHARVTNHRLGIRLDIDYSAATLPHLFEWKMLGEGTYVLGLEPATHPAMGGQPGPDGAPGTLLEPGESREYSVRFRVERLPETSVVRGTASTPGTPGTPGHHDATSPEPPV